MNYLGIDPGTSGAWAVIDDAGSAEAHVVPTVKITEGKHQRTRIDLPRLVANLAAISPRPSLAVIELVGPMPRDGTVGAFTFGASYGMVQGVCAGLFISAAMVRPQAWQRLILPPGDGNTKARSVGYASGQWPSVDLRATPRCTKLHDGKADALCLAELARRLWVDGKAREEWSEWD